MALLKRNMKNKIKEQMEERVAAMPTASSPYTLMEGETENGSPDYMFTKLKEKPSSAKTAVKYLTATPGLKRPTRKVLGALDSNKRSDKTSPKAASPRNLTPMRKLDMSAEESEENESPVKMPMSPAPQLMTGSLGKACIVM